MGRATRTVVAVGLAVTTATGLVAGTAVGAAAAPTWSPGEQNAVLQITINDNGMKVSGPTSFAAGRLKVLLEAKGGERGTEVIQLHSGYTFSDLRSDIKAFGESYGRNGPSKSGLKHLNHAIDNITAFGGVYAPPGGARHGTVLLPSAGQYVVFNDSGNVPKQPTYLNVGSPSGPQTLPTTGRIVRVLPEKNRFGGDNQLPSKGDITFQNLNRHSPHFLVLQHVKQGTTRKQVLDSFQSNSQPDFIRDGHQIVDLLTTGEAMTVRLHVPAGDYAEMCFFNDPKTGVPHAFMGMVRIVHLN